MRVKDFIIEACVAALSGILVYSMFTGIIGAGLAGMSGNFGVGLYNYIKNKL